jgi:hypothetical protein
MKHEKERRNLVQLFNIHFPNGAGQGLPRWMMNGVSDLFFLFQFGKKLIQV